MVTVAALVAALLAVIVTELTPGTVIIWYVPPITIPPTVVSIGNVTNPSTINVCAVMFTVTVGDPLTVVNDTIVPALATADVAFDDAVIWYDVTPVTSDIGYVPASVMPPIVNGVLK